MDGRNKYNRITKVLRDYPLDSELTMEALKKMIMIHITGTPKIIESTIKLMKDTGLITEIEGMRFKVTYSGTM